MERQVAVVSIIVNDASCVEALNAVLHDYNAFALGRMGIPYREKGLFIISLAFDIDIATLSEMTGRIAALKGVRVISANTQEG